MLHKLIVLAFLDKHENKLEKWILAYFDTLSLQY
jgi:hypothetical protein